MRRSDRVAVTLARRMPQAMRLAGRLANRWASPGINGTLSSKGAMDRLVVFLFEFLTAHPPGAFRFRAKPGGSKGK